MNGRPDFDEILEMENVRCRYFITGLGIQEKQGMGCADRALVDGRCLLKIKGHSTSTMQKYWRDAVLENCNYTCAVCGNKWPASELEAHHVHSRHNRITRWDWKNGVAVCKFECHGFADTRSGSAAILRTWPHAQYLEDLVFKYKTYKDYLKAMGITERVHTVAQLTELKEMAKKEG